LAESDKQTVLTLAMELDRLGTQSDRSPFTFFYRTSMDICRAISISEDPSRIAILKRCLKMIENRHFRHVMAAAFGLDHCAQLPRDRSQSNGA